MTDKNPLDMTREELEQYLADLEAEQAGLDDQIECYGILKETNR